MLSFIVIIFAAFAIVSGFYANNRAPKGVEAGAARMVLGSIVLLIMTLSSISMYDSALQAETAYETGSEKVAIAQERADILIPKLIVEVEKYVKHERVTFNDLNPKNAQILLIRYPELRSVQAVTNLMDALTKAQNLVYEAQQSRLDALQNIRFYQRFAFSLYSPRIID